jgi:hypothetical protein
MEPGWPSVLPAAMAAQVMKHKNCTAETVMNVL